MLSRRRSACRRGFAPAPEFSAISSSPLTHLDASTTRAAGPVQPSAARAAPIRARSLGEWIIRRELGWFTDFAWRDGGVVVRKTGATTPLNAEVLRHVFTWLRYFLVVRAVAAARRLTGRRRPAVWFSPDVPRPWYMIRSAVAWAGMRVVDDPGRADVAFHFDDSTWSPPAGAFGGRTINGRCRDISKSTVNRVFGDVFGYRLGINPMSWSGDAVEKAEANGLHDGQVVTCPTRALPGRCYQRLVDTGDATGSVTDLRTACVDGRPIAVWIKTRKLRDRFASGANLTVAARAPDAVFTPDECAKIAAFNAAMGLDWGTLDILRDARDGRIYIVDVNKTDVGPVLQLPMRDKIASTRAMARALLVMVDPKNA